MAVLVVDLDGTLYPKNDDGRSVTQNIIALKRWHESGNKVIIATSRGIGHLDELKGKLQIPFVFIGANGAIIVDEDGDLIERTIKASIYNKIAQDAIKQSLNVSVTTIHDGNWYWHTKDNYPIRGATKQRSVWQYIIEKSQLDPDISLTQIKVLIPSNELIKYKDHLRSRYHDFSIVSSDRDAIDIQASNATKGVATQDVIDALGVTIYDIHVVGDSENDIPMFEITDNSYCIEDGDDVVKDHTKYTTSSVSTLVKEILLKNGRKSSV